MLNLCETNKTNVHTAKTCHGRKYRLCVSVSTTRMAGLGPCVFAANGRPRPLRVCAPRPPAAWLDVVWGRTVARLRSRARGGCFYMNSLLSELCLEDLAGQLRVYSCTRPRYT